MSSRIPTVVESLATLLDFVGESGIEQVRTDLRKAARIVQKHMEAQRGKWRRKQLPRLCVRCDHPCHELVCDGCRGYLPWELRVEWRQANTEDQRPSGQSSCGPRSSRPLGKKKGARHA
jgi:hypothetical protein